MKSLSAITIILSALISFGANADSPVYPDSVQSTFNCKASLTLKYDSEYKTEEKSFKLRTRKNSDDLDTTIDLNKLFRLPSHLSEGFISVSASQYWDAEEIMLNLYVRTPTFRYQGFGAFSDSYARSEVASIAGQKLTAEARSVVYGEGKGSVITTLEVTCTVR